MAPPQAFTTHAPLKWSQYAFERSTRSRLQSSLGKDPMIRLLLAVPGSLTRDATQSAYQYQGRTPR